MTPVSTGSFLQDKNKMGKKTQEHYSHFHDRLIVLFGFVDK
jgi:hypothetical protein